MSNDRFQLESTPCSNKADSGQKNKVSSFPASRLVPLDLVTTWRKKCARTEHAWAQGRYNQGCGTDNWYPATVLGDLVGNHPNDLVDRKNAVNGYTK